MILNNFGIEAVWVNYRSDNCILSGHFFSAQNECVAINEIDVQRGSGMLHRQAFLKSVRKDFFKNKQSGTTLHCLPICESVEPVPNLGTSL